MAQREKWFIKNISNIREIVLGDLTKLPSISKGKTVDLLAHERRHDISLSVSLRFYFSNGSLILFKEKDGITTSYSGQDAIKAVTEAEENDTIDNQTFKVINGGATNDIRVPLNSTVAFGNPMNFGLLRDLGGTSFGNALEFNGGGDDLSVPNPATFDWSNDWALSLWFKPYATTGLTKGLFDKNGYMETRLLNDNTFRLSLDGIGSINTTDQYILNQRNHLVINVDSDNGAGDVAVRIYINNNLAGEEIFSGGTASLSDDNSPILFGYGGSGGRDYEGVIDEIRLYSNQLTEDDRDYLYNSSNGTENAAEPDSAGSRLYRYQLNNTLADSDESNPDATNNGATFVTGLITSGASRGVLTYFAEPDVDEELHFSLQVPHDWIVGTTFYPHIHWGFSDPSEIGDVVWGFEYNITGIGGVIENTTISKITESIDPLEVNPYTHLVSNFNPIKNTKNLTVSSMLVGRIFREGTSDLDTYNADAFILEFDLHYTSYGFGDDLNPKKFY